MTRTRSSVAAAAVVAAVLFLVFQRSSAVQAQGAGTALQFNGTNQYVTFGAAPGLGAATFTLEVWFKRAATGVGTSTGSGGIASALPLITKGRAEGENSNVDMNYFLGIDTATNKLVADFEEGVIAGGTPGLNHPVTGTTAIANNVWYHAAATYDGQSWKLYLNGVQDGTLTLAAPRPPRSDSIQHAALATAMNSTGVAAGFFAGVLDEARIWNYARTAAEVQAGKNQEIATAPGLIGRWGLNEGAGTAAADSSGSNVTGTVAGAPTWVTGAFDFVAPAAPVGLDASAGNGRVTLSWAANTEPDLSGYKVYRSSNPGVQTAGAPVSGATPITTPIYTDTSAANGTTYYYVVTAVDATGNASPASAEASAVPNALAGTSLYLNGTNQYVTFGPAPGLGTATFTLETWFKRTAAGAGTGTGSGGITSAIPLVAKGRAEAEGSSVDMNYFLGIDASSGVLVADFEDAATGLNHPVSGVTPVAVSTTTWHHAAVTYDGGTWRLYLDGVLDRVLPVGAFTPRSDSIQHAALGTAMNSTGVAAGFFAGILDEARIWNYARTQAQIQATKNTEITAAPGLLGRWGLNDATGTLAADSAGTSISGTVTNGPVWSAGYPFTPDATPPAAPQNLSATAGNASVALSWSANTEADLAGYNLYRSTSSPVSTLGAPLNGATLLTGTTFNDAAVTNGTTYYYVLSARDIFGNVSAVSNEASAIPQVANQAPVVSAGADRTSAVNGTVTLAGTATDDGLPGPLTITWTQVTGPGTATFGAAGALTSDVTFSTAGVYELRLAASDGVLATNDDVTVTVSDPVLVGAGDIVGDCIAGGNSAVVNAEATAALLDATPGAVFTIGDNAYQDGTLQQFTTCYGPTWGRHKGRTRPVTGNHDYNTPNGSGYFDYFNGVGNDDGPAGPRPGGYYSYDLPNWHVVVLNSECTNLWDPNGCAAGSAQEQWLRADLAASPTNNIIALWHRPLYSSSSAASTHAYLQPLWQALYDGGVDVILGGHWHNYERLAPLNASGATDPAYGIRTFIVGSGGVNHTGFGTVLPTSEARDASTYGVLKLTLHAASYDWQFVPIAGQTFTDSGTGTVHGAPAVPAVTGIAPTTGPATGGTSVTITGANFATGTSASIVRFGATAATNVSCPTTAMCTATSPAGTGTVDVTVTVGALTSAPDPAGRFSYNQPPAVNAGSDQDVVLPNAATLAGTATDDGVPGGLTVGWTVVSGPGTVIFADATAASTTATFAGPGVYTLRLTASDGALVRSDDVVVTATNAGNSALAFAGAGNYVTFGSAPGLGTAQFTLETWFKRTGAGTGTNTGTGGIPDVIPLVAKGRAEADASNKDMNYILGIKAATGVLAADFEDMATGANHPVTGTTVIPVSATAWHHAAATYDGTTWRLYLDGALEAQLTVGSFTPRSDSIQHASLAAALDSAGAALGAFAGVLDEARIWSYARSAAQIAGGLNRNISAASGLLGRWGMDDPCSATVSDSSGNGRTGTVVGTLTCVPGAPPLPGTINQAPGVNAGADDAITLPASATLTGSVSDDGVTGTPTVAWTMVSGPGTVTFGTRAATSTTASFSVTGSYVLALTASDGELTGSDSVTVTVSPAVLINQAPVVNAGADQAVNLPSAATLSGTVTDDGLPGGGLTQAWTVVSGPGTVAFADATAASTTATFSDPGIYTLRLTANDGALASSDDVLVTASNAGNSARAFVGASTNYVTFGAAPGLGAAQFTLETWFKRTAPGTGTNTGSGGIANAIPLVTKGRAEAEGSTVDMNYFMGIDATSGTLVADFEDLASGANHPVVGTTAIPVSATAWHHAAATYDGTAWRLYLDGALEAQLVVGSFTPRSDSIQHAALATAMNSTGVAAGGFAGILDETRIWSYARSATQIAGGMSRNIPAASGLLGRWGMDDPCSATVVDSSGNGRNGTIVGAQSCVPGAPALPGTINQAPAVSAGLDQAITLPANATLNGTASDDGVTGTPTVAWTMVSGPGTVTFGTPAAMSTTASFSAAGSYVLALTANDGELSASDTLTVTVAPAAPVNQPPVVNAGPDQVVTLPAIGVLSGSVSDDGLPGTGLTMEWTVVSGPGSATFSDPEAPATNVTFTAGGSYVLQLTASDGVLTASDSVTVSVGAAAANYALDLNGSNAYVTFGRAASLGASTFTLEAWFRRDGAGVTTSTGSGGVTAVPLVTKGRAESDGTNVDMNYFLGVDSAGKLVADFEEGSTGTTPGLNHPATGATAIQTNVWYHAAATYDGNSWRLYLNGNLDAQVAVGQPPRADSIQHAALGTAMSSTGVASGFFDGVIDEARIWNYARSQQDIQNAMTAEITAASGLIGRWGMNEGAGAAVGDSAGQAVNGTAAGTYQWIAGAPFRLNRAPAAPVVVAPAPGATGVGSSPTLDVTVSDPDGDPMTVTFFGRQAPTGASPEFTIVALPDTQHYSDDATRWPAFTAQTQWIVNNRQPMNIAFVTHLGDIAENIDAQPVEWDRADTSMSVLDTNAVPYGLAPGNHDMSSAGIANYYDQHFPVSRFLGLPWYGGYLGQNPGIDPIDRQYKDNYELFSVGGLDFVIVHLEYDMPDYSVAWADRILKQYPNRRAIISTHLFLNTSNARPTTVLNRANGTSAEAVWQTLVRTNCNVFLVLNGHYPGEGNRTDLNSCGQPVHQLLADYQSRANGGDGWLRYMRFKPSENKIYVYTFSPTRNAGAGEFETDANSQFVLDYDMQGSAYASIGTISGVASGAHATIAWPGRSQGQQYEWYATTSDGAVTTTGPAWTFATGGNSAPVVTSPGNQTSAEGSPVTLTIQASDADGNALTYTATGLPSGLAINASTGVVSGTVSFGAAATSNVTVTASDGTATGSASFVWTVTHTNRPPVVTNPGNQSSVEGASVSLQIVASDPDGDSIDYSATGLPAGLSIGSTGLISGTVAFGAASSNAVTVAANDGSANATAAFTWTVTRTNRSPVVTNPGNQSSAEGATVSLTVTGSDPDGDTLSYSATGLPSGLTINPSSGTIAGTVGFTAAGSHNVTVTANDGKGGTGSAAFVWAITDTNRPPTLTNPGNRTGAEGATVSLQVAASDPDADPLIYSAAGLPQGLAINASTGLIGGTIAYTAAGTTTVNLAVIDGKGGTAATSFSWTITDTNRAPVASDGSYSTPKNLPVSGQLLAADADGDPLTFSIVGQPRKGTVLVTNATTGLFTYTPASNASGNDTFTFKANDRTADSNLGTITIRFTQASNTAPVANNDSATTTQTQPVTIAVLANDTDPDQDSLSIASFTQPAAGAGSVAVSGTSLVYSPPGTFSGTATFTYVARDPGGLLSNSASVTVTVGGTANVAPIATNSSITVTRGIPFNDQVTATDANGDVLTYLVVAAPKKGTLTFSGSGAFTYTASAGAKGSDSFTFKATDGKADSNTAKVTISFQ